MRLREMVQKALEEDIGREDVTSAAIIPTTLHGNARIFAKQELVVCGHTPAAMVFDELDTQYKPLVAEGTKVPSGTTIATVHGSYRSLLSAERLALNFLMRLCGIATHTHNTVQGITSQIKVVAF